MAVTDTHEHHDTLTEDVFYPGHEPRTESALFRHTKAHMKAEGIYQCAVCGDTEKIESHHVLIEWAFSDAVDWQWIKDVALNKRDTMFSHKLQREVPIPRRHLVWVLIALAQGFDWEGFDVTKPETFVDSEHNQLPLCDLHHRGKFHGVHAESLPLFAVQAFLKPGYVYSPDELKARHADHS